MTVKAHVKDNKTGLERTVMPKAYALIPKRYTLLGYVDENMNPVDGPDVQVRAAKVQKKSEAVKPVVSRKQMTPEEIEAKKAELRAMNEDAIQKVKQEQAAKEAEKGVSETKVIPIEPESIVINEPTTVFEQVKERKKPGPKPKIKNEA